MSLLCPVCKSIEVVFADDERTTLRCDDCDWVGTREELVNDEEVNEDAACGKPCGEEPLGCAGCDDEWRE